MRSLQKIAWGAGWFWIVLAVADAGLVFAQPPPRPPRERRDAPDFFEHEPMDGPHSRPEGDDDRPRFHRGRPPRFDDRDGPRHGPGGDPGPLSPEQIDRVMSFTQEHFPQIHERLVKVRDSDPALFRLMIRRAARVAMPILRVADENPELAKKMIAEQKTQMALEQLGRDYRNTDDPQKREELKTRIREQMTLRFETRLERLRTEILNLQRRLDEARQDLADQEKNKQSLIDKKLDAFLSGKEEEHKHRKRDEQHKGDRETERRGE